jgi:small subunit ribosomal protein S16
MLRIKLARRGKKKQPTYRLIINEAGRDTYGTFLENLGNYDPKSKKLDVQTDRIKHWISVGAQMTDSVNNLLIANKVIEGKMISVSRLSKKSKEVMKKAEDAKKAQEDKAKAEAEAPAESTPEAPAESSTEAVSEVSETTEEKAVE